MGNNYFNGIGVIQNYNKAITLYQIACNQGHNHACNNLSNAYSKKYGKEGLLKFNQYYKQKEQSLQDKCNNNNFKSCDDLGLEYSTGNRIKGKYIKAKNLFEKACEGNYMKSCYNLALYYSFEPTIEEPNYKKINTLLKKSCEGTYAPACHNLAISYYKGRSVTQDLNSAIKYFTLGCEYGLNTSCQAVKMIIKNNSN